MRRWFVVLALAGCESKQEAKPSSEVDWLNKPETMTGAFSANHAELGTWKVAPIGCEDGREYGFQGVLFRFALPPAPPPTAEATPPGPPSRTPAMPPEEIRLDMARDGDNVIELRYPDRDATVRKVRERECAAFTGSMVRHELDPSGKPVRLVGKGIVDCPAFGLHVSFDVDGCLPKRK
ncbi:MAG: hypothetical protein IPQ07_10915 [Myxococcales bacterium]|nr:hypothetical protein [Myxococcales bacterium]